MHRASLSYLQNWLNSVDRKPLVIRGARQVGKTWLTRQLAKLAGRELIEINLEKDPKATTLFASNNPEQILLNLSALTNKDILPQQCLLFLDEIQAAPEILGKLRWFAEELATLPVIAAGSLLEFVLADHTFSMPVGRISYMHLEPLSFEEFLLAKGKEKLHDFLHHYDMSNELPISIHAVLSDLFREYLFIGGMPQVVKSWINEKSLMRVNQIQHDLLATYRDDFSKYKGKLSLEKLDEVLMAVPKMLGEKFKFSRVNPHLQAGTVKQILDLFGKARLCHRVLSAAGNGVPLAAEINDKFFKEIFLDVGLVNAALGMTLNQMTAVNEIIMINEGGLAEQVAGQLLRTITPPYIEPALFYWLREDKNANAEIDYLLQHANRIIPVEIKAGSTGSLKSLHYFMHLKKLKLALRIHSDLPSQTKVNTKNHRGELIEYTLLSLPFYLLGQVSRLLPHNS